MVHFYDVLNRAREGYSGEFFLFFFPSLTTSSNFAAFGELNLFNYFYINRKLQERVDK